MLIAASPALAQKAEEEPENKAPSVELSPLVTRLLEDDLLSDEQRRAAQIFHGQWQALQGLNRSGQIVLRAAKQQVTGKELETLEKLMNPGEGAADEPNHDEALFAYTQSLIRSGRVNEAIEIAEGVTADEFLPAWMLLSAHAYEAVGKYNRAASTLMQIRERAQEDLNSFTTAEGLTAAAQAVLMLARLEGRPAADFHLANKMLAKVRDEIDPLYWPAYVAEAELLMAKGNPRQAIEAITQALSLNPKSSEAWYAFGSMQTRFFNFDAANQAEQELRTINEKHPLAHALAVQIALRQKDMTKASETIASALNRYPKHRTLLALNAAVAALNYDVAATDGALQTFEKLAPGNPAASFAVGQALSDARQYKLAETPLKDAIRMMPGWSEPQLALGELYMQWGKLDQAAAQLLTASSLDPFHKAITNQLKLVQEMLSYETIQSEQFVVRYRPGIDEVLARDVELHMGEMVKVFIKRFGHDPPGLTQIDLMPDDQHFAVRITGMPSVWTIAACTGDVIAMTPPRPGPKRAYGTYNWLNVMGHEYAHVVNLSQTNNRVPHWFTEGCAVRMETTGRLWSQYQLLAECYNNDKLFEYDELNWGFIRPTEDYHRPLAYAQSAWIKQYIEEQHGWDKAIKMLDLYQQGVGEHEVIREVFGIEVDAFMKSFLGWAGQQVKAWGMSAYGTEPDDPHVAGMLKRQDVLVVNPQVLDAAITQYPDRPELIKLKAQIALKTDDAKQALALIKQYQSRRPVDPWSDRELAKLALKNDDAETAVKALLKLDKLEGDASEYAVELARVYRARKDYERALHFAERALLREPYNAIYRESAATIAVQKGDLSRAAFHVESLALLEPKRMIHPKRLAVIYDRLGEQEKAAAAREALKKIELQGRDQ